MRRSIQDMEIKQMSFQEIYSYYNTDCKDSRLICLYAECWCRDYRCFHPDMDIHYEICYDEEKVVVYGEVPMKLKCTIEIPYENHSNYIDFIWQMNNMVSEDGMVLLAVNNNPYSLESYLIIEDNQDSEEILRFIHQNKLRLDGEKGFDEIIREMQNRRWNIQTLGQSTTKEEIQMYMNFLYKFKEKTELEKLGYFEEYKKNKIFVSYSHKDAEMVMNIYQHMLMAGMNVWIDLQAIDVGDIITKKMLDGIRESDYAVLFLSNHYKESMMAKAELQHMLAGIFTGEKKWYPIKLDNVDVSEIQAGLENYKYYDFTENPNIEDLITDMNKIFSKGNT